MDPIEIPVFPTAGCAPIAYLQELIKFNKVCWEVHDHFPKQTFRNRYEILSANGSLQQTIPVIKMNGSKTFTRDIVIDHQSNWAMIHWRGLQTAYASSPFFDHYAIDVQKLLFEKHPSLVDFNLSFIQFFLSTWGFQVDIALSTQYNHTAPHHFTSRNFSKKETVETFQKYTQVYFHENQEFIPNVSLLDLLFCEGPMGRNFILNH